MPGGVGERVGPCDEQGNIREGVAGAGAANQIFHRKLAGDKGEQHSGQHQYARGAGFLEKQKKYFFK